MSIFFALYFQKLVSRFFDDIANELTGIENEISDQIEAQKAAFEEVIAYLTKLVADTEMNQDFVK